MLRLAWTISVMTPTTVTETRVRDRIGRAGSWRAGGPAERRLFEASCSVRAAARRLERAAGAPGSAPGTEVSLACLEEAFSSLANATLMIREAALRHYATQSGSDEERDRLEQLARLLFAVDQNLRFSAQGCKRGGEALGSSPVRR